MRGKILSSLSLMVILVILFTGLPKLLFHKPVDEIIDIQQAPTPGLVESRLDATAPDPGPDAGEWHAPPGAKVYVSQTGTVDTTAQDTDNVYGLPARCATDPVILMSPEALDSC